MGCTNLPVHFQFDSQTLKNSENHIKIILALVRSDAAYHVTATFPGQF